MGTTIELREFDGQRSVQMERVGDLVFLQVSDHTFAFDTSMALHAAKKLFNISVIVDHEDELPVL